MFTGIVEALGRVERIAPDEGGWRLRVGAPADIARDLAPGDSLAVSGVCLTVVLADGTGLSFDVSDETLRVSTLGDLTVDDPVNLERPLRLGARLGGHLVLGHVDGVGRVVAVKAEGAGRRLAVEAPPALRHLLIPKGSVALDGVSLTVADLGESEFSIALIPHTLAATTLGVRAAGDRVNLEMDVIGKYVRGLLVGDDGARELRARYGLRASARED